MPGGLETCCTASEAALALVSVGRARELLVHGPCSSFDFAPLSFSFALSRPRFLGIDAVAVDALSCGVDLLVEEVSALFAFINNAS